MLTEAEIKREALLACPYSREKNGHAPWVAGYVEAATMYEKKLHDLRALFQECNRKGADATG